MHGGSRVACAGQRLRGSLVGTDLAMTPELPSRPIPAEHVLVCATF